MRDRELLILKEYLSDKTDLSEDMQIVKEIINNMVELYYLSEKTNNEITSLEKHITELKKKIMK